MLDSIRVAAIGPREEQNAQVRDGDLDRDGHDGLDELLHRGTGSIRLLARLLFRALVRDVGRPRGLALWRPASGGPRTSRQRAPALGPSLRRGPATGPP